MSTNIDKLLERSAEIGTTEIPTGGGGSNPEIVDALMQVFKAKPKAWFRSKDLKRVLAETGYVCPNASDILFNMRVADKIQSPKKGVYGFNDGVHIDHPTAGPKSESSESADDESTE